MRVAYLNNYLSLRGGSERVMFDEAALLRRRGHDVSFFSRRGPKDIEHEHAGFYLPNVVIEELHGWAKARRAFQVVYNPAMGRAFRKFLRAVRPQVLHAHNIYGGLTTAVLDVARAEGLPTVLTAHDYKLVCPSYRALARGNRARRARAAGSIVACSGAATRTAWWPRWSTPRKPISPSGAASMRR